MSEFLKPQSPLKHKDGAYIYPLTTADQVILENGNRLNTALNNMSSKPKAGFIYPLASSIVPDGFLLCDGAEYSRVQYEELFAAIGTIYGNGDGSTTFNVPNLQTRVPIGAGESYELGSVGGEATHTLTVDEMPAHIHNTAKGSVNNDSTMSFGQHSTYQSENSITEGKYWFAETKENGGSQPHNNMQPYTVVNYIIATGKDTGVSVSDIIMGAQALPLEVQYGGTGATTLKDVRHKLGVNARNLLDNSDFTNPVNQRGQIDYSLGEFGGYSIDRWCAASGGATVTLTPNGLQLSGLLCQRLAEHDKFSGKTITLAVKVNGEILCCSGIVTYMDEWYQIAVSESESLQVMISLETITEGTSPLLLVTIAAADATFEWAALYEGEYTAETLPEYQPKGYGAELAECQRYFYALSRAEYVTAGFGLAEAYGFYPVLNTPVPMRIRPTVVYSGNWVVWDGSSAITFTSLAVNAGGTSSTDCSQVCLQVNGANNLTAGKIYLLTVRADGHAYMWFSADL